MGFSLKKIGSALGNLATGNVLGAVGTVAGAVLGSSGSKKAANAEVAANQQAIDEQARQFDLTRQDLSPYRDSGTAALNSLADPAASYTSSPGYQFALNQGLDAVKTQQNSLGRLASGNTLAALTDYGTGVAQQDFGNWWNQQQGLAGMGLGATNSLASFGANKAGNVGNLLAAQGDARSSGISDSTNAWTGALGQLTSFGRNALSTSDPMAEYDLTAMNRRKLGGRNLLAYGG